MNTELSVITVTWNSEKNIAEQINSVFSGCKAVECEEIVVDNGSKDKTVELIKQKFSQVSVIENDKNLGFGVANNKGVKLAKGRYILFLNPDMRVEEGSLDKIVDWMDKNSDAGIVSCKLVDQDNNFNVETGPRRFPKVWEQILILLKIPHFIPQVLNSYLMKDFDSDAEQEVDSVRGSFMLVRRELIEKLGWGFDPRYFIWWEDVDLCREARRLNYKVMYTPVISCVDYFGQSFKKCKTYWKQKNFSKSMLIYFQKWEPWYKWIWVALFRPIVLVLAYLRDLFNR